MSRTKTYTLEHFAFTHQRRTGRIEDIKKEAPASATLNVAGFRRLLFYCSLLPNYRLLKASVSTGTICDLRDTTPFRTALLSSSCTL